MRTWLRLVLVTVTVGGGFSGLSVLTDPEAVAVSGSSDWVVAFNAAFAAFYFFVLVSGLLFVYNPNLQLPLIIALAIQVPVVLSSIVTFQLAAGAYAAVGLTEPGAILLTCRAGSQSQLSFAQPHSWAIAVNVIPAILLVAIWQARKAGKHPTTPTLR